MSSYVMLYGAQWGALLAQARRHSLRSLLGLSARGS